MFATCYQVKKNGTMCEAEVSPETGVLVAREELTIKVSLTAMKQVRGVFDDLTFSTFSFSFVLNHVFSTRR